MTVFLDERQWQSQQRPNEVQTKGNAAQDGGGNASRLGSTELRWGEKDF